MRRTPITGKQDVALKKLGTIQNVGTLPAISSQVNQDGRFPYGSFNFFEGIGFFFFVSTAQIWRRERERERETSCLLELREIVNLQRPPVAGGQVLSFPPL